MTGGLGHLLLLCWRCILVVPVAALLCSVVRALGVYTTCSATCFSAFVLIAQLARPLLPVSQCCGKTWDLSLELDLTDGPPKFDGPPKATLGHVISALTCRRKTKMTGWLHDLGNMLRH